MKKARKFISALLAMAMMLTLLAAAASAAPDETTTVINLPGDEQEFQLIVPYNSDPEKVEAIINGGTIIWEQPADRPYYCIRVLNVSSGLMKGYLTCPVIQSDDPLLDGITAVAVIGHNVQLAAQLQSIPAGETVVVTNNYYAQPGAYKLSFSFDSTTALINGWVYVEVSDEPF